VARVAYTSSDVVLSVQPALGADSEFSKHLHALSSKQTPGLIAKQPEVRPVAFIGLEKVVDLISRCMQ